MTIVEYFDSIPEERKEDMNSLQNMIFEVLGDCVEDMAYKLPTYSKNGLKICAIASQKNYMALYIMNYDLLDHFKNELVSFNCGKSCIRFKKLNKKNLELFRNILTYIKENISKSEFYKS